jgi:hypothetical protein
MRVLGLDGRIILKKSCRKGMCRWDGINMGIGNRLFWKRFWNIELLKKWYCLDSSKEFQLLYKNSVPSHWYFYCCMVMNSRRRNVLTRSWSVWVAFHHLYGSKAQYFQALNTRMFYLFKARSEPYVPHATCIKKLCISSHSSGHLLAVYDCHDFGERARYIVIRQRNETARNGSSFPDWGKWLISFPKASVPAVGPTQPPMQWIRGNLYPEIKRPWRKIGHSFRLVQRLRMSGAVPALPLIRLHDRRRNKLTFTPCNFIKLLSKIVPIMRVI